MNFKKIAISKDKIIIFLCVFCVVVITLSLALFFNDIRKSSNPVQKNETEKATSIPKYSPTDPKSLYFKSIGNNNCVISGIGEYSGTELKIPSKSPRGEDVIGIESEAFKNCSNLISVTIPPSVVRIGEKAFIGCSSLSLIEVNIKNLYFSSSDGILYSKDKTNLVCCPAAREGQTHLLNKNVQSISKYAFYGVQNLSRIYYEGSTSDFEKIKIGQGNENFSVLPITCNYISGK